MQSALPTGDGLSPLPRHMWLRFRKVAAFARLCVFGGLCVDMWQLVHQWWFLLFWLSFDCFWRMVHWTNRQKHSKPLVYQSSQVYQDCTNSVPIVKNSQNTVKTAQKWPLVYQSSHVYQDCTNRVPTVYQKQSKDNQISKNNHWYTSHHRSTKTVPTV